MQVMSYLKHVQDRNNIKINSLLDATMGKSPTLEKQNVLLPVYQDIAIGIKGAAFLLKPVVYPI